MNSMTPERYRQIVHLFEEALSLDSRQRTEFLERRCGDDADLRQHVEQMIKSDASQDAVLGEPIDAMAGALLIPEGLNPRIGAKLGPYVLISQLGKGGMGEVFEAEDTRLERKVAIKFLSGDLAGDASALERFHLEARAIAALNHPNICTIHDIGEREGRPFLVIELMKGESLKQRLDRGSIPTGETVELASEIASALEAAHTRGILHRDIKPANIFLTGRNRAKILDFGLAKLMPLGDAKYSKMPSEHLTIKGAVMGTASYMSPEQARGEDLDARTDLFSLGVVLYEMASGRMAFGGDTLAVIYDGIQNRDPVPPLVVNSEIPPKLNDIILKLLEKDRSLRYQSAADLIADLKRFNRDSQRSLVPAPLPSPHPVPRSEEPRRSKRLFLKIALPVAALGLGVILLASRPLRHPESAPSTPTAVTPHIDIAPKVAPPVKLATPAVAELKVPEKTPAPIPPMKARIMPPAITANGIEFVRIAAGEFIMGSTNGAKREMPPHLVRITRGFEIGKYEVTQAQWESVLGYNRSKFKGPDLPVETVSWNDVQGFILALNTRKDGYVYRLPTEAEWEYACRAGATQEYAGNLDEMAWYDADSDMQTHPVGMKKPNAWGLYDMHGNVWEYVQDFYAEDYYAHSPAEDPPGPNSGVEHINRGGAWRAVSFSARSSTRAYLAPDIRGDAIGFRLVRTAQ